MSLTDCLKGCLIVSCQAPEESPFRDTEAMATMVRAVVMGGASALRLEGLEHVRRMGEFGLPIIGLVKRREPSSDVFITPSVQDVIDLVDAGAHVIAMDATARDRASGQSLRDLVAAAHDAGALVMGDVDSVESADSAHEAGVDWLGTTLSGYTGASRPEDPDIELVARIAQRSSLPVIAEGRYSQPAQVADAFAAGAWAVVVGTAISDPLQTARAFAAACPHPTEVHR